MYFLVSMFTKFIAIGLFVRDFQSAFTYYKTILKLKVKTKNSKNEFAEFEVGNTTIGLVTEKTASSMFNSHYFSKKAINEQSFTITVQVESVKKSYDELKSSGATIISPPKVMPWGWTVMCIKDIEGNIWEICALPK